MARSSGRLFHGIPHGPQYDALIRWHLERGYSTAPPYVVALIESTVTRSIIATMQPPLKHDRAPNSGQRVTNADIQQKNFD
jgi:hypothetical protein